jgi:hypothetical protein
LGIGWRRGHRRLGRSGGGAAARHRLIAGTGTIPAPRSWSRLRRSLGRQRSAASGFRGRDLRRARGRRGVCSSFYDGPAGADDPVARRRPALRLALPGRSLGLRPAAPARGRAGRDGRIGLAGVSPANKRNAGGKGLLCQRPGRWRPGGLGRRGIGRRRDGTIRGTAAPARSPAPAVLVLVVASAVGLVRPRSAPAAGAGRGRRPWASGGGGVTGGSVWRLGLAAALRAGGGSVPVLGVGFARGICGARESAALFTTARQLRATP